MHSIRSSYVDSGNTKYTAFTNITWANYEVTGPISVEQKTYTGFAYGNQDGLFGSTYTFDSDSSYYITFRMSGVERPKVPSFRFTYLLPFIRKDDLSGMGDEAIVKGITVKRQERFETAFADVLYVNGEFTKIGLYKEKKGLWNYPTPVFDFKSIHDGALAFVKSKKSGRVYICVSANGIGKYHDEEFQAFLQSFEPG